MYQLEIGEDCYKTRISFRDLEFGAVFRIDSSQNVYMKTNIHSYNTICLSSGSLVVFGGDTVVQPRRCTLVFLKD